MERAHLLVKEALNGGDGLNRFILEIEPMVRNFVRMFWIRDHRDEEELINSSLFRIVRNLHTYDVERGRLESWIYAIVKNSVIEFLRRKRKEIPVELSDDNMDMWGCSNSSPHSFCEMKEITRVLESREGFRELRLRAMGYSIKEIAAATNRTESAVKIDIFRQKLFARNLLKEYAPT
ncbi:MAG: RNA polymerase sigma factor [Candidatus Bathyarchaeia archaeon]